MSQIEQAYSPVHMRLPSRFVITARRQTFSIGILEAYIDSSDTIGEKDSKCSGLREPHSENPVYQDLANAPATEALEAPREF